MESSLVEEEAEEDPLGTISICFEIFGDWTTHPSQALEAEGAVGEAF